MKETKNYRLLLFICLMAILVRVAVFFVAQRHTAVKTYEYETIATNLLKGEGFLLPRYGNQYRSAIAPLYPYLCAAIYFLFGHHHAYIIYLQIIVNVAMCCLVFKIGQRILNEKVGLLSAALVAFHPGLIFYSSMRLHSLTIYAFFICAVILMIIKTLTHASFRNQIILGIFFGLGIITRPTLLCFLPFSFLWFYLYLKDRKKAIMVMLRVTIIVFLILAPWLIRNYLVYDEFIFIQTNQGEALWLGNNINASGTLYLPSGRTVFDASPDKFKEQLYSLDDELDQMKFFMSSALEYIKSNPLRFLTLTFKKFIYFWWFSPQSGILYPAYWLNIYRIYYSIIALFALLGFIYIFNSGTLRKFGILIMSLFISISMLHSFYYPEGRHRWSLESFILIFSATGLLWLFERVRKRFTVYVLPKISP